MDDYPIGARVRIGQCEGIVLRTCNRVRVQFPGVAGYGSFDPKFVHLVEPPPLSKRMEHGDTGDWTQGDLVEYDAYGLRFTARLTEPDGGRCWKAIVETTEGRHELDEPAGVGDVVSVVYGHSVKIASGSPVVDSELRDRIVAAFDKHEWAGGDHANHPLEDFVAVAVGAVAPALKKAYLDGHDSGYAAANVDDPWAEQSIADTELRNRIAEVARETSGTTEGSQYYAPIHWDDVAEEIHAKVVGPVLAARDAQTLEIARLVGTSVDENGLEHASIVRGIRFLREQKDDCKRAAGTLGEQRDNLTAELQRERESRQDWAAEAMRLDAELARARCERSGAEVGQPDTEATAQAGRTPLWHEKPCETCGCDACDHDPPAPATPTEPRVWRKGDPDTAEAGTKVADGDSIAKKFSEGHWSWIRVNGTNLDPSTWWSWRGLWRQVDGETLTEVILDGTQ